MTTLRIGVLVSALTVLVGSPACGNVDNAIDCDATCDRYKECFDPSYDEGRCYDNCRARSEDSAFRNQVGDCHDCIGEKSCSGAAFNCASECSGVVP